MDAALDYIEAIGEAKGIAKVNKLGILMYEAGRWDDFLESVSNGKLQKRLFIEYGIDKE